MRVVRVALAISVAFLLAGCTADEPPAADGAPPPSATGADSGQGMATSAPASALARLVEEVVVAFDGNLGIEATGCVIPASHCTTVTAVDGLTDLIIERPGASVAAVNLTLTWTATTPATVGLRMGAMVMDSCDGCESVDFAGRAGTSPVVMQEDGLDLPLTETAVLHVYVYNPIGVMYDPALPAYSLVSVEQEFRIEGTVTLLVPAAGASAAA